MNVSASQGEAAQFERVVPVSRASDSGSNQVSTYSSPTANVQNITSVSDLKKAELAGQAYTVSDEQIVKAIERAIKAMQGKATNLQFSVHEQTKMIAVKILDSESGEVLREIPPEKSLDFIAKLWEMAGIFVDEKR